MKIAIKTRKTANNLLSVLWGTNRTRYVPAKLPTTANAVKSAKNPHWSSTLPRYPTNPDAAFAVIIKRDDPSACFIGTLASKVSPGTIRNPPPTPTRPVRTPTATPSTASPTARPRGTCMMEELSDSASSSSSSDLLSLRNMKNAATSITAARRMSWAAWLKKTDREADQDRE